MCQPWDHRSCRRSRFIVSTVHKGFVSSHTLQPLAYSTNIISLNYCAPLTSPLVSQTYAAPSQSAHSHDCERPHVSVFHSSFLQFKYLFFSFFLQHDKEEEIVYFSHFNFAKICLPNDACFSPQSAREPTVYKSSVQKCVFQTSLVWFA